MKANPCPAVGDRSGLIRPQLKTLPLLLAIFLAGILPTAHAADLLLDQTTFTAGAGNWFYNSDSTPTVTGGADLTVSGLSRTCAINKTFTEVTLDNPGDFVEANFTITFTVVGSNQANGFRFGVFGSNEATLVNDNTVKLGFPSEYFGFMGTGGLGTNSSGALAMNSSVSGGTNESLIGVGDGWTNITATSLAQGVAYDIRLRIQRNAEGYQVTYSKAESGSSLVQIGNLVFIESANRSFDTIAIGEHSGSSAEVFVIDNVQVTGGSDATAPAAPANLLATPGITTILLDWDDNSDTDIDGYHVYRSTSSGVTATAANRLNESLITSGSSYTDSPLNSADTYYYIVTAVDIAGNESGPSNEVSANAEPVPAVSAPTFLTTDNSAQWTPGQLIAKYTGLLRQGMVGYMNGNIYMGGFQGPNYQSWIWSDPSDPSSITLDLTGGIDMTRIQGGHGYFSHGGFLGGGIAYVSPGINNAGARQLNPEPYTWQYPKGDSANMFPWQMQMNWNQYGGASGEITLYRGNDIVAELNSSDVGVIGPSFVIGNLLIVCSDETDSGVATYDLSPVFEDPAGDPVLLDKLSGSIGGYLPAIWENYVVMPTKVGNNNRAGLILVDFSDPTSLKLAGSVEGLAPSQPGNSYVQFQDNYAFIHGNKINMDDLQVELVMNGIEPENRPAAIGSIPSLREPADLSDPNNPYYGDMLNTSQYNLPVGNLMLSAGYPVPSTETCGLGVWVHQAEPDTKRPYVGYHLPKVNATNFPVGAPVTLMVHETLEMFTVVFGETVKLTKVSDGSLVPSWLSHSHDDLLTITPYEYLEPNTEYEVEIVDNGIRDAADNGIIGYTFRFSTGSTVPDGNEPPVIADVTITGSPANPGGTISFDVSANDPEGADLEYRVSYGDGAVQDWISNQTSFSHTYPDAGHYNVKVEVREKDNTSNRTVKSITVTVAPPVTGTQPTKSSPIALDAANERVWVVNPDNDSVTVFSSTSHTSGGTEIDLAALTAVTGSIDPRSVAIDSSGNAWIACHDADRVLVVNSSGGKVAEIVMGYGSSPAAVAPSPDGSHIYITTQAGGPTDRLNGELIRYNASTLVEDSSIELGPMAREIAVSGDESEILVGRFISGPVAGEIWEIDGSGASLSFTRTISLFWHRVASASDEGPGVPNYISSITISPDGQWAWYTAKKDNVLEGGLLGETELRTDSTVRAMIGRIDLSANLDFDGVGFDNNFNNAGPRIDFDNVDSPSAVAFSPRGDWAFVTAQGNNLVGVFDVLNILELNDASSKTARTRVQTDLAPQGIIYDEDTELLWVKNFTERTVTVIELASFISGGDLSPASSSISTVGTEKLSASVLNGKQIFYNALDGDGLPGSNRMSEEGYISCATCHIDGMHDGRTFDFTQRGEGLRNTTDLRGRAGTGHGNVHWTANFDEIHDFNLDIVNHFGGKGFPLDTTPNAPLGTSNNNGDSDLNDLVAYVTSLGTDSLPKSPFREIDGEMTTAAQTGASLFDGSVIPTSGTALTCATCHNPATEYTDSAGGDGLAGMHNVGTLRGSSGFRLDGPLSGIDTPTLLGVWNSAPYLHNGAAPSLEDVFYVAGGTEYQFESSGTRLGSIGTYAYLGGNQTTTISSIDGGNGGAAQVDIVYSANRDVSVTVTFNAQTIFSGVLAATFENESDADGHPRAWQRLLLDVPDSAVNSGTGNTLELKHDSGSPGRIVADYVTVSNDTDLAQADAHRQLLAVKAADQTEYDQVIAYIKELDGRPATPAASDVTDYLVHWKLDGDATDSAGSADGTLQNNPAFVTGNVGQALSLDGVNQYVSFNASELEQSFTARTLVMWIKANGTSGTQMLYEEGAYNGFGLRIVNGQLEGVAKSGARGTVTAGFTSTELTQVALRYDAGKLRLFINGAPAGAEVTNAPTSVGAHGNDAGLGYNSGGDSFATSSGHFAGLIDETRIYARALSDTEIQQVYDATSGAGAPFDSQPTIGTTVLANATSGSAYSTTLSATEGDAPLTWSMTGNPAWLSLDTATGDLSGTPLSVDTGTSSITFTVTDNDGDTDQVTLDLSVNAAAPAAANLSVSVWDGANALSPEDGWQSSGSLAVTYTDPVIVASVAMSSGQPPVVPMIREVSGSEFEIKLVQPVASGADATADYDVTVLVVEAGDHGAWEAGTFTSTVTDHDGSWSGQQVALNNSYTAPVILGQVTVPAGTNPSWSVFWSAADSGGSVDVTNPATGSSAFLGKHVGEDSNTSRANAKLGYIVIESGAITIDGNNAYAALSGDVIEEIDEINGPAAIDLSASGFSGISSALAATVEMDDANGGWAVLANPGAISGTNVSVAIEEDEYADTDNDHTTETVGILAFEDSANLSLTYGNGGAPGTGDAWTIAASGANRIEAENFNQGGAGEAYSDTSSGNSGGDYRTSDVDIQTTSDTGGGYNVGWISQDEWLEFTIDVAEAGTYNLSARVASSNSNPADVNFSIAGTDLGTIAVEDADTNGWQDWLTKSLSGVNLSAGPQVLRVTFVNSSSVNLNWIELQKQ